MALGDAANAAHDPARGAVAALEGVALDEGGLQGMKLIALGQAPVSGCAEAGVRTPDMTEPPRRTPLLAAARARVTRRLFLSVLMGRPSVITA
jgi:hypothetical protein